MFLHLLLSRQESRSFIFWKKGDQDIKTSKYYKSSGENLTIFHQ